MTLLEFIQILSRRKWVIILTTFFTVLVFALAVFNTPPRYTAKSSVRILTTRSGSADYITYDVDYATRVMNTYMKLATSATILEELGRYVSPVPEIEVNIVPNSELIEISATDIDPALARFAANKLGDIIVEQSKIIVFPNEPPVTAYVAEPATLPDKPSSPSPYLLVALGLAVGLIGGLALTFIYESLDTRLYTVNQIEAETNLLTIGNIPDFDGKNGSQNLYIFDRQVGAESFRRLTANIISIQRDKGIKSFLVTSCVPKDGRSLIVANLAITLAQTNRKVLMIDADLRKPKLHEIFAITNTNGLTRLLTLRQDVSKSIFATAFERVNLLPSGPRPVNPIEILDTTEMQGLIHYLEKYYDVILLDSPPCLSVTDPITISSKIGGVMLVVREAWVRREVLQATLSQLRHVNANLVGVVINRSRLGSSFKNKILPQPQKNGSAPKGRERDLRPPDIQQHRRDEPKTKKIKEPKQAPPSPKDKPSQDQSLSVSPEEELLIPRPPRHSVMPSQMGSNVREYSNQVIQKPSGNKPAMSTSRETQPGLSGQDIPETAAQDRPKGEADNRAKDILGQDYQEARHPAPIIRERIIRQPASPLPDDIRSTQADSDSQHHPELELERHARQFPRQNDLDYERYLRERELYVHDPAKRLQREQERQYPAMDHAQPMPGDQQSGRIDRSRREEYDRYASLDELDINGIDDYPSPPGPSGTNL